MPMLAKGGEKKQDLTHFHIIKLAFSSSEALDIVKCLYEYFPAYINVLVPDETLLFGSGPWAVPIL